MDSAKALVSVSPWKPTPSLSLKAGAMREAGPGTRWAGMPSDGV